MRYISITFHTKNAKDSLSLIKIQLLKNAQYFTPKFVHF